MKQQVKELSLDDLADLVLFAKVVDAQGFTPASKLTGIPQASISRRVASLEDRIGIKLLERSTRRVSITQTGERLYRYAKRIVNEKNAANADLMNLSQKPSGVLKISAPVVLGQHLMGPILAKYSERYPDVRLKVELSQRHVDVLEEGFDVAIRAGNLRDSNLGFSYLGTGYAALYASAGYLQEHGNIEHPGQLQEHRLCSANIFDENIHWICKSDYESVDVKAIACAHTNDFELLAYLGKNGGGIIELPTFSAKRHVEQGELVRVLPEYTVNSVDVNALFPSYRGVLPALRAFIELARKELVMV